MKTIYLIITILVIGALSQASYVVAQNSNTPYEVEYHAPNRYKDFRLAIGGGYAYRLGKTQKTESAAINSLNAKLRHGFSIDADAQYFFKETWGLGINAIYQSSSTSGSNIKIPDMDTPANLAETQSTIYIGPSYIDRLETEKFLLISNIGLGPVFYNSETNINGNIITGTQTTFGMNVGISGEYKLSAKTGIGLKLSYVLASISDVNVAGQKVSLGENGAVISNLMISAFISFKTW